MNFSICNICGGELAAVGSNWQCRHCGGVYPDDTVKQEVLTLQRLLDERKMEQIANLRRCLYEAITAEYTDSNEVCRVCAEIKTYLPDDFMATFFDTANRGNVRQVAGAIRKIDAEKQSAFVELIFSHMLSSLCCEYVLPLQNLIERAYKKSDLAKFEQYSTRLSEEAARVDSGLYETALPRDVFVAYASRDMDKVEELVELLEENGLTCFVAARNLRHGRGAVQNYQRALEQAMDNCRSVVFVSTPNSRNMSCDAIKYELPYIRRTDMQNAPAEYRHNYATMPTRYKRSRVEYRLATGTMQNAADAYLKEFFEGYEYAYSPMEVADRVFRAINEQTIIIDTPAPASSGTKFCAGCGKEVPAAYNFCTGCAGTQFVPSYEAFLRTRTPAAAPAGADVKYCASCGQQNRAAAKFCSECGGREFVNSAAEVESAKLRREMEELRRQIAAQGTSAPAAPVVPVVPAVTAAPAVSVSPQVQSWFTEGDNYFYGKNGKGQNYEQAVHYYRKAALQGHPDAQYCLGLCYRSSKGITRDYEKAVEWFQKAADQGHAKAQYNLGDCYHYGYGVAKDAAKASYWYAQAAARDSSLTSPNMQPSAPTVTAPTAAPRSNPGAEATYREAEDYFYGQNGKPQSYEKAAQLYRRAADQGLAKAQCDIGYCYENGKGVPKDPSQAFYWYQQAAAQGHAVAQNNLGLCYEYGRGTAKDISQAYYWYSRSAEQGYAKAQYNIGYCYEKGKGVTKDAARAFYWYQKSAEQGYAAAQDSLGDCYYYGRGTAKDLTRAVHWFNKGAEQGQDSAQYSLGFCYEKGHGVAQDYSRAFYWYQKAAEQDHDEAQNRLGDCYYYGRGTAKDFSRAAYWFGKAADQGLAMAQYNIGFCYEKGKGVAQDHSRAFYWYQKGAEQDHDLSENSLGDCYYFGRGVGKDYSKAVYWFTKAAKQDHAGAQYSLGYCYEKGQGVTQDYRTAVYWYQKGAEQGDSDAQNSLGDCYYFGRGVTQDYNQAAKWFAKAADQDNASAQYSLGFCYKAGQGVPRDRNMAYKWLSKAAAQGNESAKEALKSL